MFKYVSIGMVSSLALMVAEPALAQETSDAKIIALQQHIKRQQEQLDKQQAMLNSLVRSEKENKQRALKAQATAEETKNTIVQKVSLSTGRTEQLSIGFVTAKGPHITDVAAETEPTVTMTTNNRPGWRSADGENSIELTSLFQLDTGANSFSPAFGKKETLQKIQSGVNARRMQIGVDGTFANDFHYVLHYDFGNTDETIGASGGPTAGFKVAYVSYTGLRPFGTKSSIELGYKTPPIFLDEALGSSNGLFLEHPTPDRLATGFASGEGRAQFGIRDYTDRFFGTIMLTGPKAGDDHTQLAGGEQLATAGRFTYNFLQGQDYWLHAGGGFQRLITPTNKSGSTFNSVSLSDNAELRVDPTNIISVPFGSTKNPVSGGGTYSTEVAGVWGPLLAAGEYYWYDVERNGLRNVSFQGGYAEAAVSLTGETHPYVAATGAFGPLEPKRPFKMSEPAWGAWELTGRYSFVNMNDSPNAASAVLGGVFHDYTLGLNWYANSNVKLQLNWMHGDLTDAPLSGKSFPGQWDEVALRTQFGF